MTQEKKKCMALVDHGHSRVEVDLRELLMDVLLICNLDDLPKMRKRLEWMMLATVNSRDLIPDDELDPILSQYINLQHFYDSTAPVLLRVKW